METHNCFADGVQMTTGCTFGDNALIFRDVGKTATPLALRGGKGIRVALKPGYPEEMTADNSEAQDLFERFIRLREKGAPRLSFPCLHRVRRGIHGDTGTNPGWEIRLPALLRRRLLCSGRRRNKDGFKPRRIKQAYGVLNG